MLFYLIRTHKATQGINKLKPAQQLQIHLCSKEPLKQKTQANLANKQKSKHKRDKQKKNLFYLRARYTSLFSRKQHQYPPPFLLYHPEDSLLRGTKPLYSLRATRQLPQPGLQLLLERHQFRNQLAKDRLPPTPFLFNRQQPELKETKKTLFFLPIGPNPNPLKADQRRPIIHRKHF